MNILLIGSSAREQAIAQAIKRSSHTSDLFCLATSNNPGIQKLSTNYAIGKIDDQTAVLEFAKNNDISFAIIGPEAPLAAGVADKLWENNIACLGPKQKLAQIETSKGFARNLLTEYNIPGCPKYKCFSSLTGVEKFLQELGDLYVIKADGLMGGKGVKVAGDHLNSHQAALTYCQELINMGSKFVIEEKLIGQEFTLMSFCDGQHLAHLPAVQDHKRAYEGDAGPNTGGMGSYSEANHILKFLTGEDIRQAWEINQKTAKALRDKFNEDYKGILYGGFIITKNGVKLIEYNARLGDPEAMNVLAILESDFIDLCQATIKGNLNQTLAKFANQATVCKYAVPLGYPDKPIKNQKIEVSEVKNQEQLYYASVDQRPDGLYAMGSRTVAVVGIGHTLAEAEKIAEQEIRRIKGPLFHRRDIGTEEFMGKKTEMMRRLKQHEPIKLAVLGSTKGADLEAIVKAINSGELKATIEVVIGNKPDAYILERAKNHGLETVFVSQKNTAGGQKTREEFDQEIIKILDKHGVDLILLIGYMRILSTPFVKKYKNRIINVHPSLLPAFAGGMDLNVHEAVLKAGVKVTGCTIHLVDEGVDTGPIITQKWCAIAPDDTPDTLKAKVQKLEGQAFIEAIRNFKK